MERTHSIDPSVCAYVHTHTQIHKKIINRGEEINKIVLIASYVQCLVDDDVARFALEYKRRDMSLIHPFPQKENR